MEANLSGCTLTPSQLVLIVVAISQTLLNSALWVDFCLWSSVLGHWSVFLMLLLSSMDIPYGSFDHFLRTHEGGANALLSM